MQYVKKLESLIDWIRTHPGLTTTAIEKSIKAYVQVTDPLIRADGQWIDADGKRHHDYSPGFRYYKILPKYSSIKWKLRYLELTGDVFQRGSKWYVSNDANN